MDYPADWKNFRNCKTNHWSQWFADFTDGEAGAAIFIWNRPYNRQAGYDYQKFVYRHRFKGHRNSLTTDYWKSIENQLDAWCFWPFAVSWGNGCWRRIHHGRWKYKIQSWAGHLVKKAKNFTSSPFSIYIKVLAFHLLCHRDRFFDGYCENSYRQSISCRQDRHPQSN